MKLNDIPLEIKQFSYIITKQLILYLKENDKYLNDIYNNSLLCASLQIIIKCLFCAKYNDSILLLTNLILTDNKQHIYKLIISKSSSNLMETIFTFNNRSISLKILKNYLNAKDIRNIALNINGNYVLQSILKSIYDKASIQYIASSLQHSVNELYDNQRIGILYHLINAFNRVNIKPSFIVKTILDKVNNNDNDKKDNIIYKFLYLNVSNRKSYSTLGCLLFQSILLCNVNFDLKYLYLSFIELDNNDIINILRDSCASFIIQSFIESQYIFDEIKWKFLIKFQDKWSNICTNKSGNYVMESVFYSLNFPYKLYFVRELIKNRALKEICGSKIGLILFNKMKLDLLQKNELKWKDIIMKQRKHKRVHSKNKVNIKQKISNNKNKKIDNKKNKKFKKKHNNTKNKKYNKNNLKSKPIRKKKKFSRLF